MVTDLPKLRVPCTIPPFPWRPPISAAMLMKLSTLRCKFPSGMSRLSFPHSHAKMQPEGACAGIGGTGQQMSGSRWVSFSQAPRPRQDVKSWLRKGAYMTPITGRPPRIKAIDTQNMGNRWA